MEIKVKHLNLLNRRKIFISDIHGNLLMFKNILKRLNFNENDYLFILGDFVGKGEYGLEVIRYIMELTKMNNTFVLMGNHEMIAYSVYYNLNPDKFLDFLITSKKPHVIILDMLEKLNIKLDSNSNIIEINNFLKEKYEDELEFLVNLDHVIYCDEFYCAHAGLFPKCDKFGNNIADIIKTNNFKKKNISFDKLAILGHWPCVNYSNDILNCNPFYDKDNNTYYIDGGLMVKDFGQMNALILDNGKISYIFEDNHKTKTVLKQQQKSENPKSVIWIENNDINLIDKNESFCKCLYNNQEIDIYSKHIYFCNGQYHSNDTTNYFLDLKVGERVFVINSYNDFSFVKKDGLLGWCYTDMLGE